MTLRVSNYSNQPCSVIFVNFYNFLNNDVIMSLLVSTGNCKLGHDCQRVCSRQGSYILLCSLWVYIPWFTPTRQNSFVPSAVCTGHYKFTGYAYMIGGFKPDYSPDRKNVGPSQIYPTSVIIYNKKAVLSQR